MNQDQDFIRKWTAELLKNTPDTPLEQAFLGCSGLCFEENRMGEKLQGIRSVREYADILRKDFGWEVEIERTGKGFALNCFENNTECLCPVVCSLPGGSVCAICCCTESELKRMTEFALHRKAEARVLRSFVRDNQSCVYRIEIPDTEADQGR